MIKQSRKTLTTKTNQPIKITTKREKVLVGLALSDIAIPQPSNALREVGFLFRGSARTEKETYKQYSNLYEKIYSESPSLKQKDVIKEIYKNKKFLARILCDHAMKSIYYQCIILHIAKCESSNPASLTPRRIPISLPDEL